MGAMKDVTMATMTMIENICGLKIPSDRPMVATTISMAPRAFMATAIDAASQKRRPPQTAPTAQPTSLPRQATPTTTISISGLPSPHRSTFRPTMPKKTGARMPKTNDSSRATVSLRMRGTGCRTTPATKAPKTACTPIRSVSAAHNSVTTIISTRSESTVRNRSAVTRTRNRSTGCRINAAKAMNPSSISTVSPSSWR